MFNLLPLAEKNKIHHEALIRLFIAVSITLVVSSIFGCLVLYSAKLYLEGRLTELKLEKTEADRSVPAKVVDFNKEAILFNKKVNALLQESNLSLVDTIEKISVNKPVGVFISGFSYLIKDSKTAALTVSAVAVDREAILKFVDNLRKEAGFSGVDVPVSNFAKDTNIAFSLSLNATF